MAGSTNTNKTSGKKEVEDEDDYMGDLSKFLPPEPSSVSSKPKPRSAAAQPSMKTAKIPKELEKERKLLEEDRQTLANLESEIPQSNIGFKMLKLMGYTPGSALGKAGSGLSEPLGIDIRRSRAGIGREDPLKEKMRREKDRAARKRRKEEELLEEFGSRQKSQWRSRRVVVNFRKAKAALDQLENREVVEEEKNEEAGEAEEEEEEEVITEEDLQEILMKLRGEHHYCLFCGCQYESMEALQSNCPGVNEDDH
ncbi:hypothetical protein Ancab_030951 [Ancistrocladus abbreviatus]